MNLSAAESLGDLQQHRSAVQRHVAGARFEAEKAFRTETGESVVLKQKL